jgi:hypothetical protein
MKAVYYNFYNKLKYAYCDFIFSGAVWSYRRTSLILHLKDGDSILLHKVDIHL